jgi:hypothetical protein
MTALDKKWFEQWREPSEFLQAAKAGVLACFCADKAVPNFLREAYVAGAFGRIWRDARGPCKLRLHEGEFPDAQFRADGVCLSIEITMALDRKKKMFDEWREIRAKTKQGQIVLARTYEERQASAREAIPRVVKQKANKNYVVPPSLLIYTDDGRALVAQDLKELTRPWKDHFHAIYLLCGMDVVEAWPVLHVLQGKEAL